MPQRASVGDAEVLRVDAVPPEADAVPTEADAGRARVMLGQKGLTQSLEANVGVFVGQIRAGSRQSVYPGFQLEHLSPIERYYCRDYSLLGEPVLAPRLYSETA